MPSSSSNLEVLEVDTIARNNGNSSRFLNSNIKFFDSFYNSKSFDIGVEIEYIEKEIYFYDILIFINRIKDVVYTKGTELV